MMKIETKADDALSDGIESSFYSMVGEIKMNIFKLLLPSSEFYRTKKD